jgi:uncharacterized protein (UPF0335 family)
MLAFLALRRLHETLQLEIIVVIESLERLEEEITWSTSPRPSPHRMRRGRRFCGIVGQKPGVLDELAAERIKRLETEGAELQRQAAALASEIAELNGDAASRIG